MTAYVVLRDGCVIASSPDDVEVFDIGDLDVYEVSDLEAMRVRALRCGVPLGVVDAIDSAIEWRKSDTGVAQ